MHSMRKESMDSQKSPEERFMFGKVYDHKAYLKHIELIKKGLVYSVHLLKGPSSSYLESRQIELKFPDKSKNSIFLIIQEFKKTLILDLDETLITSCSRRDNPDKVLTPHGDTSATQVVESC